LSGRTASDVFVRDRVSGLTSRVSLASDGSQGDVISAGAAISADGRYVAFASAADNLVPGDTNGRWDVFIRDRLGVPRFCVPPNLTGSTVARARRLLAANECRLGKITGAYSRKQRRARLPPPDANEVRL